MSYLLGCFLLYESNIVTIFIIYLHGLIPIRRVYLFVFNKKDVRLLTQWIFGWCRNGWNGVSNGSMTFFGQLLFYYT